MTTSSRTRRVLAVAVTGCALLSLAACTDDTPDQPDFSTAGTLAPSAWGGGDDWKGPAQSWGDTDVPTGSVGCGATASAWHPETTDLVDKGTAAWAHDDTIVWSLAYRFSTPDAAQDQLAAVRQAEKCTTSDSTGWKVTFADTDGKVVVTEHNTEAEDRVTEVATAAQGDVVATVVVSYPEGGNPPKHAAELLDPALQAAAATASTTPG